MAHSWKQAYSLVKDAISRSLEKGKKALLGLLMVSLFSHFSIPLFMKSKHKSGVQNEPKITTPAKETTSPLFDK